MDGPGDGDFHPADQQSGMSGRRPASPSWGAKASGELGKSAVPPHSLLLPPINGGTSGSCQCLEEFALPEVWADIGESMSGCLCV